MLRTVRVSRAGALPLVVAILAWGCTPPPGASGGASDTTPSRGSAARAPIRPDSAHVLELANTYVYTQWKPPVKAEEKIHKGVNHGVPKGSEPQVMWIARAEEVRGGSYPADEEILALVFSNKDYQGLGIRQGYNFLWRNRTAGGVWLISVTPSSPTELVRDNIAYTHSGSKGERRLVIEDFDTITASGVRLQNVALGFCIDDPSCGGHCGYSQ